MAKKTASGRSKKQKPRQLKKRRENRVVRMAAKAKRRAKRKGRGKKS